MTEAYNSETVTPAWRPLANGDERTLTDIGAVLDEEIPRQECAQRGTSNVEFMDMPQGGVT